MARAASGTGTAAPLIPPRPSVPRLRRAAATCRACHLWMCGTQTVFGEGPGGARVMLVGEQPGDREDKEGRPFVGPAGRLLDEVLESAGLDRGDVYVTNAVKHFKWEAAARGERRIHKKPNAGEIKACRPWLDAEIRVVRPALVVCLGATAAQALLGKAFRITRDRGKPVQIPEGPMAIATMHPSAVLRVPDSAGRAQARKDMVADLKAVAKYLSRMD